MKLHVQNYLGCRDISIDAAPGSPVILCGPNGSGKSSFIAALAHACGLEGTWSGVHTKVKDLPVLVSAGQDVATVTLSANEDTFTYLLPSRRMSGTAPRVHPLAVTAFSDAELIQPDGTVNPALLGDATITAEDLAPFVGADDAVKLAATVAKHLLAGARQAIRDSRSQLTGVWNKLTGDNYGSVKGAERAAAAKALLTIQDENAALAEYTRLHGLANAPSAPIRDEGAIAILRQQITELEELIKTEPENNKKGRAAKEAVDAAQSAVIAEQAAMPELLPHPESKEFAGDPCPKCGAKLSIVSMPGGRHSIKESKEAITPEQYQKALDAREVQAAKVATAQAALTQAQTALAAAKAQQTRIADAKARWEKLGKDLAALKAAPTEAAPVTVTTEQVAEARAVWERTTAANKRIKAEQEAAATHEQIVVKQAWIDALEDDSAPAAAYARATGGINTRLAKIVAAAGTWLPVTVTPECRIKYGDHDWLWISHGERQVVAAALRLAVVGNKSDLWLFDGTEAMQGSAFKGLLAVLSKLSGAAVIGRMVSARSQVAGMPGVCWVEGGTAGQASAAAA